MFRPTAHYFFCGFRFLAIAALPVFMTGCNVFGWLANGTQGDKQISAAYNGLQGQSVAILVDADERQHMDYPNLETDLSNHIVTCLNENKKSKELEKIKFQDPYRIADFQAKHPELRGLPPTEIAHMLGVTRVIWVEVSSFSTRSDVAIDLLRGSATCNLRVIEVKPKVADSAKVVWKEDSIGAKYPDQEGESQDIGNTAGNGEDAHSIYLKTCETLALRVAERFYTHDENESIGASN